MDETTKKCKHCGMEIPKSAKVCPHCRKKQGGKLKTIFGVIVIAFILVALFGGNSKSDASKKNSTESINSSEQNETSNETEAEDDGVINVGESFEKSGLKITVNEASTDFTEYDDPYGWNAPQEGMKYVMASFTFENTGSSDMYVSIYDFDCYADNTSCEQVYTLDDNGFINENLSAGRNVSFETYYMVPKDAQTIELEYETNVWTSKKVIVKLQ